MKFIKLVVVLVSGLSASSAIAAIAFEPEVNLDNTFENVDFFYNLDANVYQLAMFSSADLTLSSLAIDDGQQVGFSPNTVGSPAPFTATNIDTSAFLGGLLGGPVTGNPQFYLGLFDGTNWLAVDHADARNTAGTAFNVVFAGSTPGNILAVDMVISQIPVPAAVWLFGSGLIGLVGVARRRA